MSVGMFILFLLVAAMAGMAPGVIGTILGFFVIWWSFLILRAVFRNARNA